MTNVRPAIVAFVPSTGGVGNAALAIEPHADQATSIERSDVSDALRAFSDDMRDRRLLRAEERAKNPMVGPVCSCFQLFSALRCCRADLRC